MKTSIFSINNLQTLSKEEFAKNVLLKEISRQLEEEQENYESQRRIVCESDVPRFADPNDRATREETSAVAEALLRGMGARIEKLRAAEKRITISIQKKNLDEILSCHECGEGYP
ncbi:MAG: hypothetical protein IPN70_01195 [Candidatus Moraniibacteriota bacterium]|nr:MAG: hypothetical protein IPN70_01195 [Candidatus Moranbacteria bacterium]